MCNGEYNTPMGDIRAAIFDADGTIFDTRELIFEAYEHVLTSHGYAAPTRDRIYEEMRGNPAEITYAKLAAGHAMEELMAPHRAFQAAHADLWSAYEGLRDLLEALRSAGIKMGICTSRGASVVAMLEDAGVSGFFESVVHADLVENLKPHPQPVLKVLGELGIEPPRAVMIGDTDADIGSGKAAGVAATIGLTHGIGTRKMLEDAGADYIIDHLSAILPLVLPQR